MLKTLAMAGILASSLIGGSAIAASPKLSHFAHLMAEAAVGENAPVLSMDFGTQLRLGNLPLQLEVTPLADVARQVGAAQHVVQEANGPLTWTCMTRRADRRGQKALTAWFLSTSGAQPPRLDMLVMQEIDAAKVDGCAIVGKGAAFPSVGLPGVGSTARQLKARFGTLPYDKVRNVYYDSARAVGAGKGKSIYQRLGYVVTRRGDVTGIAIGQTTN